MPTTFGSPSTISGEYALRRLLIAADALGVTGVPPSWGHLGLSNGVSGVAMVDQWDMVGVTASVTYTVSTGSLPPGLSLTAVGTTGAKISGTPTTAGSYTFSLTATNSIGSATQSFTVVIATGSGGATNYGYIS